jgi:hypothetical protein
MTKLFITQWINTGLIVLFVHMNYRGALSGAPGNEDESNQLYGDGKTDDFDIDWYVLIGSGLCLTLATQIYATTVQPVRSKLLL